MESLAEALESIGEKELISFIPWRGDLPTSTPPEGIQQLYSIGFQLLNMVEERVAASIRREREKTFGADSIRGLWAETFTNLKSKGISQEQILEIFKDIHVEGLTGVGDLMCTCASPLSRNHRSSNSGCE